MKTLNAFSIFVVVSSIVMADSGNDVQPVFAPTFEINKITLPIILDGDFGDEGWKNSSSIFNFVEFNPGENIRPPVETKVMMTYDDKNLYVAFFAYDDPKQIRASYQNRDEAWSDDFVAIIIDTYGDANAGIMMASNPYGIQMDSKNSGNNENPGFDIFYESKGMITAEGYQVEMAIPFSSLSFPDQAEQDWRVTFYRSLPRENRHQIIWGGLDLNNPCWLCQLGHLKGLSGIRQTKSVEFLPALVGGQAAELNSDNNFKTGPLSGEPSLGIKYSFSSNLSLEVTLNPDFSQVEADVDQIDVNTTFALYYPEKRPFFNEGAELFDTWINAIYTRSINNPTAAGRIISQSRKHTFSFLSAIDEDSPYTIPAEERSYSEIGGTSISNIFRYRRSLDESSFIGVLMTDRRMSKGGSGSVAGFDTRYRFSDTYQVTFQSLFSWTEEPADSLLSNNDLFDGGNHTFTFDGETFNGNAVEIEFSRETKNWNLEAGYEHRTPTFRADNGFITRNNSRQVYASSFLHFWPNGKILSEVMGNFYVNETRNFEGETKKQSVGAWSQLVLPRQLRLSFNFNFKPLERFHNIDVRDQYSWNINFNSQFSKKIMFGGGLNMGVEMARSLEIPEKGNSLAYWGWGQLKATEKFIILPEYSFFKLTSLEDKDGEYEGFVARLKLNYQFNSALSIRLVGQYNDFSKAFDFQPLLSYEPNPFTIFYIGSTQDISVDGGNFSNLSSGKTTARQYFMKFQYLFRS